MVCPRGLRFRLSAVVYLWLIWLANISCSTMLTFTYACTPTKLQYNAPCGRIDHDATGTQGNNRHLSPKTSASTNFTNCDGMPLIRFIQCSHCHPTPFGQRLLATYKTHTSPPLALLPASVHALYLSIPVCKDCQRPSPSGCGIMPKCSLPSYS